MAKRGRKPYYSLSREEWLEFTRLVALVARANGYYVLFAPRVAGRLWSRILAGVRRIA